MNLTDISKTMKAARLVLDGSFKDHKQACAAMNIPYHHRNRISDARAILTKGCPELIAGVESGMVPLATGWHLARECTPEQQRAAVQRIERYRHHRNGITMVQSGIYRGKRPDRRAERHERQIRDAVDNLLVATMERVEAAVRLTTGERIAPDREQVRKWRSAMRHSREGLKLLEQRIDWSMTHERLDLTTTLEGEGDGHDVNNTTPNQGDGHNDSNSSSSEQ